MTAEKAAAYYILGSAALGIVGLLVVVFLGSPSAFIFGFAGLCALALGYCYWNYWR